MPSTILTDTDGHTAEPFGTLASVGRPESFYIRCDVWHRVPIERRVNQKNPANPAKAASVIRSPNSTAIKTCAKAPAAWQCWPRSAEAARLSFDKNQKPRDIIALAPEISTRGPPNLKGRQMAAFSLLSVLFKIATAPATWRCSPRFVGPP